MEPFKSSRSSTFSMSNCEYFASRTPSATFSKSQKTARLRASWLLGMRGGVSGRGAVEPRLEVFQVVEEHRSDVERQGLRKHQAPDHCQAEGLARATTGADADGDRQA